MSTFNLYEKYELTRDWFTESKMQENHAFVNAIPELSIGGAVFEVMGLTTDSYFDHGVTAIKFVDTGNMYHIDSFPDYWAFFVSDDIKSNVIRLHQAADISLRLINAIDGITFNTRRLIIDVVKENSLHDIQMALGHCSSIRHNLDKLENELTKRLKDSIK